MTETTTSPTRHGTVLTDDTADFDFPGVVAGMLGVPDLERLHELGRRSDPAHHDQDSDDHTIFYREYGTVRVRAMPLREFVDRGLSTVNAGRRMDLEGYYRRLTADGSFTS